MRKPLILYPDHESDLVARRKKNMDVLTTIDLSTPATNGTKEEPQPFSYGPRPYKFIFEKEPSKQEQETLIFVIPSTSRRVVSHQLVDKVKLISQLREMVEAIKQGKLGSSDMEVIPTDDIQLKYPF
ncbi:hypothetical protein Clacol_004450 [Clathrus columnatus]|uniref:Uncharacterized protein n=1 Tax=Clathrus columnatus TaxID=1419009 RepID=A0AAV5ABY1_9AGAM|nr:hypothetical protein Clacol_004450 [Clathrus columnatus]